MTISVLIATRNRPNDLIPCLRSLLAQNYDDYEIVVVDQSDSEESAEAVCAAFSAMKRLRYIRSQTVGKTVALNQLIASACGDILAFTDDDTEAPPDWLTGYARVFRDDPQVDIVFGQVFPGEEGCLREGAYVPSYCFTERRILKRGEISGMGANMGMRRDVVTRVGPFDVLLGPGTPLRAAEEGDFVYRAHQLGMRVLHEPGITLIHRAWRPREEWDRVLFSYGVGDAAFALKHLRCRDWKILGMFLGKPLRMFARICRRKLQHRTHREETHYLRGYWKGIQLSKGYRVDRRAQLYIPPLQTS